MCRTLRPFPVKWLISDAPDTGRLPVLFENTPTPSLVDASRLDRPRFVPVAERARTAGAGHCCSLFVRLVRGGLWHHITQDDEDAAHWRLKRYFYRDFEQRQPVGRPEPPPRIELSDDARFAAALLRVLRERMYRADPFHVVMREFPEFA